MSVVQVGDHDAVRVQAVFQQPLHAARDDSGPFVACRPKRSIGFTSLRYTSTFFLARDTLDSGWFDLIRSLCVVLCFVFDLICFVASV